MRQLRVEKDNLVAHALDITQDLPPVLTRDGVVGLRVVLEAAFIAATQGAMARLIKGLPPYQGRQLAFLEWASYVFGQGSASRT